MIGFKYFSSAAGPALATLLLLIPAGPVQAAGNAPQPTICTRGCWGARAAGSISYMSSINRAIVHHTAGNEFSTTGYEDSKANVRAIQNLHMNANGWSDIGYHFLVDKFGNTFEGRYGSMSSLPKGAHDGTNSNSFGFNAMGYFHPDRNDVPTAAMMNALYDVIAWRMPNGWQPYGSPGTYGPLGYNVGYVDSHRRVKGTACPGDNLHNPYVGNDPNTGTIRSEIKKRIDGVLPPPPMPLILINRRGDFNGDGKDDIITFKRGGTNSAAGVPDGDVIVAMSNGAYFGAAQRWHEFFCVGEELPFIADVNGDGKDDILLFKRGGTNGAANVPDGDVFVALSNGAYFGVAQKWHEFFCIGTELPSIGDFNGDGKDDILLFKQGGNNGAVNVPDGDVVVALSNGAYFGAAQKWHEFFCVGTELPSIGDVNGDGKDDILLFKRGGSNSAAGVADGDVLVTLSNGAGFNVGAARWHEFFCIGNELPGLSDFNGDRKDDLISFKRGGGNSASGVPDGDVVVTFSNGAGFNVGATLWHEFFCVGTELPMPCSIWL